MWKLSTSIGKKGIEWSPPQPDNSLGLTIKIEHTDYQDHDRVSLFDLIRRFLVGNGDNWLTPGYESWTVDLDELKRSFNEVSGEEWARGKIQVIPGIGKYTTSHPRYRKTVTLYISPESITATTVPIGNGNMSIMEKDQWDVFISHASPDKDAFVVPLAEALHKKGVRVWLDQRAIGIGDSISMSINEGLAKSRFGIVVLSKAFFNRSWPQKELGALLAQESDGRNRIIPIWHGVEFDDIMQYAPVLADRMAARSDEGIARIVDRLLRFLNRDKITLSSIKADDIRELTLRLFPELPVDEFWQTQLIADMDASIYQSPSQLELAYRRAKKAVEAFAQEEPRLFRAGTDYLTKSLGFVDLCFRSRHSWADVTKRAFEKHSDKIDWNVDLEEENGN